MYFASNLTIHAVAGRGHGMAGHPGSPPQPRNRGTRFPELSFHVPVHDSILLPLYAPLFTWTPTHEPTAPPYTAHTKFGGPKRKCSPTRPLAGNTPSTDEA